MSTVVADSKILKNAGGQLPKPEEFTEQEFLDFSSIIGKLQAKHKKMLVNDEWSESDMQRIGRRLACEEVGKMYNPVVSVKEIEELNARAREYHFGQKKVDGIKKASELRKNQKSAKSKKTTDQMTLPIGNLRKNGHKNGIIRIEMFGEELVVDATRISDKIKMLQDRIDELSKKNSNLEKKEKPKSAMEEVLEQENARLNKLVLDLRVQLAECKSSNRGQS